MKILVIFTTTLLLNFLFLGCNTNKNIESTAVSNIPKSPKVVATPTLVYSKERILRGEKIYKSATTKYNFVPAKPIVSSGWCKDVIVPVPITEWKKLSAQDKVNVSLFAENVILDIRANPKNYIEMTESAPMYKTCFDDASNMSKTCWRVEVGSVATIDGETNLGPDSETVVDGKTVAEFRKIQEKKQNK